MGTVFSFDVRDRATERVRQGLADAVAWLHHVDRVFSTYREDSAVSRLRRGETTPERCPAEVAEVLALCEHARRDTDGYFSAAPDGRLDPSGLVKGWAVERASWLLHNAGAHNTSVNGGGDIQLRGESAPGTPWRVGVAHPLRPGELVAVAEGNDLAVATSGTAERGAHILDPHTGRPARGLLSVTVTGRHLTWADVLATAVFAKGSATLPGTARAAGYEVLAVTPGGEVRHSDGFPAPRPR
ncbi:FAD:protein FMN transferase [Streptomyces montanisoli]|uniref:FAD:protein FMN transferase n=1 Tax=Streptomyces montanisoli TaxID=2798581 RepID=A0A940RWV7_9ACTN|nr:FAD:protein FMN transferase [Streptomyces montanisoli]MBP0457508.1 FAD:protein FMN transferase [Streptomyces montanisoli]